MTATTDIMSSTRSTYLSRYR